LPSKARREQIVDGQILLGASALGILEFVTLKAAVDYRAQSDL
jgi:hypothetical protein